MNASKLIDALGGTSVVADLCSLTTGAVSQWRPNGIPKPWLKYFSHIRPDLFPSAASDHNGATFDGGSGDPLHGERRAAEKRGGGDRRNEDKEAA